MTLQDCIKELYKTCKTPQVLGQVPPGEIQLVPAIIPRSFEDIERLLITHAVFYHGYCLGYVNRRKPLPEFWICHNHPEDYSPGGYSLLSYIHEPVPDIGWIASFPNRRMAERFLNLGQNKRRKRS